jgi:ubiquitin-protein ligase
MNSLVKAISKYETDSFKYEVNDSNVHITTDNGISLYLTKSGRTTSVTCEDNVQSQIMYNILSDQTNLNVILDLIEKNINKITNYCVCCYMQLEYQSDSFVTCGSTECNYKFEELSIGNCVLDCYKYDEDIFKFLLESALEAMKCDRKYDIFEPFPRTFLEYDGIDIQRGAMSKLSGKNYDQLKDFKKLYSVTNKLDINNLCEKIKLCYDDRELEKEIGLDLYKFIRFVVLSCKVDIKKDNELSEDSFSIYKISHPFDKEDSFTKKLNDNKYGYLFHGSKWQNWYSILRNGLKNCSKTKLMTAGAVHGNGIYLSDNAGLSMGYGTGNDGRSVMGIFELAEPISNFKKITNIFVVADETVLIQRYLIITKNSYRSNSNIVGKLNNLFNTEITKTETNTKKVVVTKNLKRLIGEYRKLNKLIKKTNPGFKIEVDPKNPFFWKIFIDKFDEETDLGKDMIEFGIDKIELEMIFPHEYPFEPPFVRIVSPRFKYQTGHVTSEGALCMEILTQKGWVPSTSIESLVITIESEILQGGGRLDRGNIHKPYSEARARESFIRVCRGHGWM